MKKVIKSIKRFYCSFAVIQTMLNWIWFSIDPWDIPGVTGLQLGFSYWSQHSDLGQSPIFKLTSLLIQSLLPQLLYENIMAFSVKRLTEIKIDKIHFSLFISTTPGTPLQKVISLLMSDFHWWINADLQWYQLPPSALMDASHHCSWTYEVFPELILFH